MDYDDNLDTFNFSSDMIGKVFADSNDLLNSRNVKIYSNNTEYSEICFSVNGQKKWLDNIILYNLNKEKEYDEIGYIFIFLNEVVDESIVKTIAQSYSRYE
jgi:hypothetical protein